VQTPPLSNSFARRSAIPLAFSTAKTSALGASAAPSRGFPHFRTGDGGYELFSLHAPR
jgi:hypothetical protein